MKISFLFLSIRNWFRFYIMFKLIFLFLCFLVFLWKFRSWKYLCLQVTKHGLFCMLHVLTGNKFGKGVFFKYLFTDWTIDWLLVKFLLILQKLKISQTLLRGMWNMFNSSKDLLNQGLFLTKNYDRITFFYYQIHISYF